MTKELIEDSEDFVSRSQLKRDMQNLQKLGQRLIDLSDPHRQTFSLPEELEEAITEYKRLTKNEARRRQLQFIGKLMRRVDHDAIQEKFLIIEAEQSKIIKSHHLVEDWRDKLLTGDPEKITEFLSKFPNVDRQTFRHLVKGALKEEERNVKNNQKISTSARKLFQFVRDNIIAIG